MGKEDARADSRKRLRESGSQTDGEDAFDEADGHCCGKLDEVSEKLDKVLTRLGELEAMQGRVVELEKEKKSLQESLNTAHKDIVDLNSSSTAACAILETHAKNLEDLNAKIKHLECRNIKLEAYTRRENLKVFNVPEGRGETEDICIVERLFSSSLVAIVSLSAPRKLKVCHFKKGTEICNYSYPNTILAVRLNRVRLLVVLEESLYIHNIRDMKVLHTIRDTPPNPSGLCALSVNSDNCYLAYPGSNQIGEVQIFDCVNLRAVSMIPAHDSPVAAMAFNSAGTKLSTASEKGTVIRVFSIPDGGKLYEFRRGVKRCVTINSLAFSHDSLFLSASSNTETVHIFKLEAAKKEPTDEASGLMGYFGKALSPSSYLPVHVAEVFNQERAFASVRLPQAGLRNVCAIAMIGKLPRLLVSSADGYLYIYNIDPEEGGDCTLLKQHRLIGQGEGPDKAFDEESAPTDPSSSSTNKEDDSQDTRARASSQTSQNSPPLGVVGTGDFSQAASAFGDQQGAGNLRLDDESEYPPLTVHND